MKSITKAGILGLLAVGAATAALAAPRPDVRLVSTFKAKNGHDIGVWQFVHPNGGLKAFVSDAATVNLNTPTTIDGWAFIDQTSCKQIGMPAPFDNPTNKYGVWSNALEQSTLGSGACSGQEFTFSSVVFTWTKAGSPAGKNYTQHLAAKTTNIHAKYGLGRRAKIVDFVTVTYAGS